MTISVTRDDILLGCPSRCLSCPIARALERETGRQWAVEWHSGVLEAETTTDDLICLSLPPACVTFVEQFDRTNGGEPFSFELDWKPERRVS